MQIMSRIDRLLPSLLLLAVPALSMFRIPAAAQATSAPVHPAAAQLDESRASHAYEAAVRQGPPALRAFLTDFPKGADLHVHLSGAVYAETLIRDAGEDGLCVDTADFSLAAPPCTGAQRMAAKDLSGNITRANQLIYDRLVDSLSMRSFVPSAGWSGHDQFFVTFDRDRALKPHTGEWIDDVATRAAAQNEQYLELMDTPPFTHALQIANAIGWSPELERGDAAAFAHFRQQLLDRGLREEVAVDRDYLRQAEAERSRLERCGTAQAAAACRVEIRYIWQVLRALPPSRFLRRRCSALKRPKPASTPMSKDLSPSTSSSQRTALSPCAITRYR